MDAVAASLCRTVAEGLRPLYEAARNARLDWNDAFWIVYDEAVVQVARAKNMAESTTKSVSRDMLQEIMFLVME
ncbi:MAG: hypothetical protein P8Z81_08310 [Deinococcales bacterium]|jgi:hypothetical protein